MESEGTDSSGADMRLDDFLGVPGLLCSTGVDRAFGAVLLTGMITCGLVCKFPDRRVEGKKGKNASSPPSSSVSIIPFPGLAVDDETVVVVGAGVKFEARAAFESRPVEAGGRLTKSCHDCQHSVRNA